ncbi:putative ATP-dependent RNA helicase DDX59 [Holothuria leucospilota]|uniref:RNA helicase n=1 Tax=Holothuria leucospilota TaxID=206669 RepID=A0A9Q1BMV1_HOLLE|nr:putative ATP-dependent RNA helicase DDX59 [Holothuria leucospilota]
MEKMFLPRSVRTQAAKPAIKRPLHRSTENDGENSSKVQKLHIASGSNDKNDIASKCWINEGEKESTSKISVPENTETGVTLDQAEQPANISSKVETLLSSAESNLEVVGYEAESGITERGNSEYSNFGGKEDSCVVGHGNWQTEFTENISQDQKTDESVEEDDPIVSYSKNQRWPEEGEPVCVVCGRYGEYICDKTEADVCSLECKARNLARMKHDHGGNVMNPTEEEDVDARPEDGALQETAIVSYSYMECLEISRLTKEQVQDMRAEVEIFVEGMDVPRPVLSFEQLFLPPKLLQNLKEADYVAPTPVQMQVIPAALKLRDLMVCAPTSSGKTASFVIPSILHAIKFQGTQNLGSGPISLILTPTRELAQQIEDQTKTFMKGIPNMRTALLVGGLPMPPQLHRLRQNIQVVIATPGRLLEILRQGGLSLKAIKLLVIDEVDSMLQFGFQEQVEDIQSQLPDSHQTLLFSATIPATIEKLSEQMLKDPIYISIGTPSIPCSSVKQILLWVEDPSKKKKLFNLLEDPKHYQYSACYEGLSLFVSTMKFWSFNLPNPGPRDLLQR